MKKQIQNTTQNKSEPPAVAGGLIQQSAGVKSKTDVGAQPVSTNELGRAGARSPELLFNSVRDTLQFADDGTLLNAAALVKKLRDAHPEQFGTHLPVGSIDAGAGVAVTPQLTRDALAKMKPAEIAELDWNDVKRVLAS